MTTPAPHAIALRAYLGAFADELVRAGVTDVCICPGSRSTPLSIVLNQQPGLRTWMHLDERSAAFFALGLAKGSRRPVAVVATSGTAVVNFAPAVAEAYQGFVPLLLLTTDRPAELRGIGSTQTLDQVRLFGPNVKWSEEMLLPEATPAAARYVRAIADRAVATALAGPMGPVHLNFPFREPLIPAAMEDMPGASGLLKPTPSGVGVSPAPTPEGVGYERAEGVSGARADDSSAASMAAPTVRVSQGVLRPDRATVQRLADELRGPVRGSVRGVMVCGGQDDEAFGPAARSLSRSLGFPLLADVLSQTRCGPDLGGLVIDNFDAILRVPEVVAEMKPDVILRLGATQISKPLAQYLERNADVRQIVVTEAGLWTDPQQTATEFVYSDATAFCQDLDLAMPWREESGAWIRRWIALRDETESLLRAEIAGETSMTEAGVIRGLPRLLPEGSIVFAGNSMPVRDLDSFFPGSTAETAFLCNRGVSGIDGVTSTALGVAAATGRPTLLAIGDVSFYHDMNGLLAAQRYGSQLDLTIVVINNDGGGIFSFLPQKSEGAEDYEKLWGTPHGLDFRHAAALYGIEYTRVGTPADYDSAVRASVRRKGVSIVEVQTERDANLAAHNRLWARVAERLRG